MEEVATGLGRATLFVQEYTECTNFCGDFEEPIAIIALEEPVDPAHTSIVLQAPKGDIARDELRQVLATMRALDGEQ